MLDDNNTQSTNTSNVDDKAGEEKDGKVFSQKEVDKLLDKRFARLEEKHKTELAEAKSEWERQAKLTEEERQKEADKKRNQEMTEKETELTLRERTLEAKDLLIDKGLDTSLVGLVVNVDEKVTKQNVDDLSSAFNKAVEKAVTEKLKGKTPTDYSKGEEPKEKKDRKMWT